MDFAERSTHPGLRCLTGKSSRQFTADVQPCLKKYSDFPKRQIIGIFRPSCPTEGRFAIVTDAGQDAVDVEAPITNGAEADGEVVWSRRPDAGVKFAECNFRGRWWQESPVAMESAKEAVKTIARGVPGVSGVT